MPRVFRLDKKIAMITGGSSGLGLAAARLFAARGARVVLLARDADRLDRARSALAADGLAAEIVTADVRRAGDVTRAVADVESRVGPPDVLLNNAGTIHRGAVTETSPEEWAGVVDTSLTGAFLMARAVLPAMIARRRGVILNTSSYLALHGAAGATPAYGAAKAGLLGLTRSLAVRHGPDGIRVNAILPAFIRTPLNSHLIDSAPDPAAREREMAARYPLRRLGRPEDFASAALFLASDEASFITGHGLALDGGITAL